LASSGGIEKKWTGYNDQNDDIAGPSLTTAPRRSSFS
jgi:hypothetical protein